MPVARVPSVSICTGRSYSGAAALLTLAVCGLAASCSKKVGPGEKGAGVAVARVDDEIITSSEVDAYAQRFAPAQAEQFRSPDGKRKVLEQLLRFEVFAKEASDQGYDRDPEVLFVAKQQMTTRLVRDSVSAKSSDIPDSQINEYYSSHAADFAEHEQVRVAEIVVADRALANTVVAAARALQVSDMAGFRALVAKYSEDQGTKAVGGDLGILDKIRPRLPPMIGAAASKLTTVGQVTDAVPTEHGFAILRLTEKVPSRVRALPEVKDEIRERLLSELRAKRMEDWSAQVRAKHKVTVLENPAK
jgi:peptidyl-prolyl cis-trans isomerase C